MLAAAAWAACVGGAMAADVQRGSTIYSTHCTICHGADGTPVMPGAPNFRRMESLIRPDSQLLTAIRNGKGPMPAYYGVTSVKFCLCIKEVH